MIDKLNQAFDVLVLLTKDLATSLNEKGRMGKDDIFYAMNKSMHAQGIILDILMEHKGDNND